MSRRTVGVLGGFPSDSRKTDLEARANKFRSCLGEGAGVWAPFKMGSILKASFRGSGKMRSVIKKINKAMISDPIFRTMMSYEGPRQ